MTTDKELRPLDENIARLIKQQVSIKENFIARYLHETGAKISDNSMLVERRTDTGFEYHCEPRRTTPPTEGLRSAEDVLPCDLKVGVGTFKKGVAVSTAQPAIDRLYNRMLELQNEIASQSEKLRVMERALKLINKLAEGLPEYVDSDIDETVTIYNGIGNICMYSYGALNPESDIAKHLHAAIALADKE